MSELKTEPGSLLFCTRLEAFIVDLILVYQRDCYVGIDGADFQELMIKHNLAHERPATEEDCETYVGREFDVQVGDNFIVYAEPLKELLEKKSG